MGCCVQQLTAYGTPFDLTVPNRGTWELVEPLLPPGTEPRSDSRDATSFVLNSSRYGMTLTIDGESYGEYLSPKVAVTVLDQQVRLHVAAHADRWLFVHAGVVVVDDRALLLPGGAFSGKTTLVDALLKQRAAYYSDEYAVLDADGRVHPYRRPLSHREVDGFRVRYAPPPGSDDLPADAAIALVVFSRYIPGADWRPEAISASRAVVQLMANAVPARARAEQTLKACGRAMRSARALVGDRGEADATAALLLSEMTDGNPAARRRCDQTGARPGDGG